MAAVTCRSRTLGLVCPCLSHTTSYTTPSWQSRTRTHSTSVTDKITEWAYTSADAFPPLSGPTLRIYSMRFCPYAQRARLVAAHKGVRYEEVNINLEDKPTWYLNVNPDGTVPMVHHGVHMVCGSGNCMNYLNRTYPDPTLLPPGDDSEQAAHYRMGHLDKVIYRYYLVLGSNDDGRQSDVHNFQLELDTVEKNLTTPFLFGDDLSLVDYFIWPWFERLTLMQRLSISDVLPPSRYPRLTSWITAMLETPGVKSTYLPPDVHRAYRDTSLAGKPDYNLGLKNYRWYGI